MLFHVLNRGMGRTKLFANDGEYEAFEQMLERTQEACPMRICAYSMMPRHWHLLLWPKHKGDLGAFLFRLGVTHSRNWQVCRGRIGTGRVYESRYRSFPVEKGEYFYRVARYVEGNALRAGLVEQAEQWRWSSLWHRVNGKASDRARLCDWPSPMPRGWKNLVNREDLEDELEAIRHCVVRGRPYGGDAWVARTAEKLGLQSTLRPLGRPRKDAS